MNTKELGELRRRLRPNKNAISHVYGCYVGATKEIIGEVDQSLALLSEDDAEGCLSLLKKALSGSLGRNLIDVGFTTQQVAEGEEHKLLRDLRDSKLKDRDLRRAFYEKVIQSVDMGDDSYLILLAHDTYDVPFKSRNTETASCWATPPTRCSPTSSAPSAPCGRASRAWAISRRTTCST